MLTAVTYNLHSGKDSRGKMNLNAMIEAVRAENPDIVAVQEVACHVSSAGDFDQAAALRDGLGMHMAFVPAIAYNGGDYGVALLSRHPMLSVRAYHIPDIEEERRDRWFEHRIVLMCRIDMDGSPVTVLCTHLGLSEGERENGVRLLCRLIDECADPVLLMGDLNTAPDEPLLAPLLNRLGEHGAECTYPSEEPNTKIDYILTSPGWQVRREHALDSLASDHLALAAEMELSSFQK